MAHRCEAQNLVPNGSFEETDSCWQINTWYYPETGPLGWFSTAGSGDYFLSCLPYGAFNGVPLSMIAFQYPQDGSAYVGVITYHDNGSREYFAIELAEPLQVGATYYASFYASASWNGSETNPQCWVASSGVGMHFSMQAQQWEFPDPMPPIANSAQIYAPEILADTVNWVLVSGSFVADSAYQYVIIGNHFDNPNTDTIHFGNFPWNPAAHMLIDNVCVSLDPVGCPLAVGVLEARFDGVVLFPNPAVSEVRLSGLTQNTHLWIRDALGRLVWAGSTTTGTWHMDVGRWARGVYSLRMDQGGTQRTFKFVLAE